MSFTLSVLFANDSSIVSQSYFDQIAELAEFIKVNGIKEIAIVGHTSVVGSDSYNMILSKHRAKAVAQRLKNYHGITVVILQTVARGESELKDASNTRLADSSNRRVEVTVEARMVQPVVRNKSYLLNSHRSNTVALFFYLKIYINYTKFQSFSWSKSSNIPLQKMDCLINNQRVINEV